MHDQTREFRKQIPTLKDRQIQNYKWKVPRRYGAVRPVNFDQGSKEKLPYNHGENEMDQQIVVHADSSWVVLSSASMGLGRSFLSGQAGKAVRKKKRVRNVLFWLPPLLAPPFSCLVGFCGSTITLTITRTITQ